MMHDLAFDLVELVPCPGRVRDSPGVALREVAFREDAWLPEEVDRLRAWFGDDEDLSEVAVRLGRTLPAVRTKVAELGLRRNSSRPWTEMDDAYLAEHYGTDATSAIASVLGRSAGAIYARAGLLQLTEGTEPPWSEWEIAQVRAGYERGTPVAQLGVLIGRTTSAVGKRPAPTCGQRCSFCGAPDDSMSGVHGRWVTGNNSGKPMSTHVW